MKNRFDVVQCLYYFMKGLVVYTKQNRIFIGPKLAVLILEMQRFKPSEDFNKFGHIDDIFIIIDHEIKDFYLLIGDGKNGEYNEKIDIQKISGLPLDRI